MDLNELEADIKAQAEIINNLAANAFRKGSEEGYKEGYLKGYEEASKGVQNFFELDKADADYEAIKDQAAVEGNPIKYED